ncbi:hypothetical protein [Neobacillus vireti]|uniref:hypothetical protein n=1 Tax=Neobacillus vireti TaxID=220686 RepID=UPI002FFE3786
MKDFHCCATCRNFQAEKKPAGMVYYCSRLGFETKTNYKFDCWSPKKSIIELMDKSKQE